MDAALYLFDYSAFFVSNFGFVFINLDKYQLFFRIIKQFCLKKRQD